MKPLKNNKIKNKEMNPYLLIHGQTQGRVEMGDANFMANKMLVPCNLVKNLSTCASAKDGLNEAAKRRNQRLS